ncbi:DUF6786 family protein [Catenovulum sediminis]|uniref:DUF6786 family protein n=1 Tax=Catenovulum sediminis TaxID=1740262 RepID=A0ABV1REJ0_9ALTE
MHAKKRAHTERKGYKFALISYTFITFILSTLLGCVQSPQYSSNKPSFKQDIQLLSIHYKPVVLKSDKQAIIVLPELQGRIMSATLAGQNANAIGWFNREYLKQPHTQRNAVIGGVQRLIYGPETGQFSQFFQPNSGTTADDIYYQNAITFQNFNIAQQSAKHVKLTAPITLTNHAGYTFNFDLTRNITLLSQAETEKLLSIQLPESIEYVSYGSQDEIIHTGNSPWTKKTGLVSLWTLAAYQSNDNMTAIIPFKGELKSVTPYFNETKKSHTKIIKPFVFYRADGEYMNKIGIPVNNTRPYLAAYDSYNQRLTIEYFHISNKENRNYLTASWITPKDAYNGEIVNIFNDGPDDFGHYFGHFFELEASSAAFELAPGESQKHFHYSFHFSGEKNKLNQIAKQVLGLSLDDVSQP